jgi:4'-phosphopantetheinyl transferase EntD
MDAGGVGHNDLVANRGNDPSLAARPVTLPEYVSYALRRVGDPGNTATAAEMGTLHPRTVATRRAAFVAGRTASHAALTDLGCDVTSILSGPMREPLWPPGIVGSLSHAGDVALALAAPREDAGGVGVDIEELRPAPELWDQVPLPAERTWLAGLADQVDRDRMMLALFSAKEAVYKAFFPRVGHYFGFQAAALHPAPFGFTATLVVAIDDTFAPGRPFPVHSDWFGDMVRSWLVLPA